MGFFFIFFFSIISIQGRGLFLGNCVKQATDIGLHSDVCVPMSFKRGIDTTCTSLNDLSIHSRSQGHEESNTFAIILL